MIPVLIMWTKSPTEEHLKVKVFWNKAYGVIISIHGVFNKILPRDSNYIINVFLGSKFEKDIFLRGSLGSGSIIWD